MILLQMSDLSGPAPVQGFDGYLSGFPLSEGIYVLARTWYATELPRPGCVWTHSLLLSTSALQTESIYALLRLFRRPAMSGGFEEYSKVLNEPNRVFSESLASVGDVGEAMKFLYADSKTHVCVMTESAAELESDFLAIWNQQWPTLRRRFTFTTGLLGSGPRLFDLQGIPWNNRRLFQDAPGFVILERGKPSANIDRWVANASKDATLSENGSPLRRFLWSFGGAFQDGRWAFRRLCETHRALSQSDLHARASTAYACISDLFNRSEESRSLKTAIFAEPEGPWAPDEVDALEVIARDGPLGVIEHTDAALRARADALSLSKHEDLVLRLVDQEDSQRVRVIVDAFYERCDVSAVVRLPVSAAVEVLKRRPDLARDPSVWQRSDDSASVVLQGLTTKGSFSDAIAYGLLGSENVRLLHDAENAGALEWVRGARAFVDDHIVRAQTEEFILGRLWNSQSELHTVLNSVRFGSFLKFAAAALDASRREAEAFPLHNVDLRSQLPCLHDRGADLQACAFLVVVALSRKDEISSRLASEAFSAVYLAAREQRLPWDLWRRVEPLLPWHLLEWDRCARLVEGMVGRFLEHGWSSQDFFGTFSTDEEFDRAVSVAITMRRSDYVQRLRHEAQRGKASRFQVQRLNQVD